MVFKAFTMFTGRAPRRNGLLLLPVMGLLFATALTPIASLAASPQLEDFAAMPALRFPDLSPAGDRMAFLSGERGHERIAVMDLVSMEILSETAIGMGDLRDLVLLDDGSVIVFAKTGQVGRVGRNAFDFTSAYHVPRDGGQVKRLLEDAPGIAPLQSGLGRVVGVAADGRQLYMPAYHSRSLGHIIFYGLFQVDLANYRSRLLTQGEPETIDWFVNSEGHVVAREDFNGHTDRHSLWAIDEEGEQRPLFEQDTPLPTLNVAGLSRDEQSLVIVADGMTTDGNELYLLDLESEALRVSGFGRPSSTINNLIMDLNRRVAGVSFAGLMPDYRFFDATLEARVLDVQQRFEGTAVRLVDWSEDFSVLLFHVSGSRSSGAYVVSNEDKTLKWVGEERPGITTPAAVRIIRYRARDGLEIPALLTLPPEPASGPAPGAKDGAPITEPAPLVVLPHGGPKSNDELGFDWLAQYLAHQGIVVLQPQFRGSTGQGIAFQKMGLGQWGRAMSTDLDDGVRYLVREGLVDPRRVCMVGSSYGGYAALAAGAFSDLPYRCLVSISGVADLRQMLRYEAGRRGAASWNVEYLEQQLGTDRRDRDALEARSPVAHAERFQAPVLLLHGEADTVVPSRQSESMARALKRAGKPFELQLIAGEDHWLTQESTRLETLKRIDAFLREHGFLIQDAPDAGQG